VVDGKTNEITAFAPLLDRIDITGAIITRLMGTHWLCRGAVRRRCWRRRR
jgi:hypothetical protein